MFLAGYVRRQISPAILSEVFNTCALLGESHDFSNENGACREFLFLLSSRIYYSNLYRDPAAIIVLMCRLMRRLISDWQYYLSKDDILDFLCNVIYDGLIPADEMDLLISESVRAVSDSIMGKLNFPGRIIDSALLHLYLAYARESDYLRTILRFDPELHELRVDRCFSHRGESPTSLAMYSSWAFVNWVFELRNSGVNIEIFLKEELKSNCKVHPGWSQRSLVTLFEFDYKPGVSLRNTLYCADCKGGSHSKFVQPSWRHLLERIKRGQYLDGLQHIGSKGNGDGNMSVISSTKARYHEYKLLDLSDKATANRPVDSKEQWHWEPSSKSTASLDSVTIETKAQPESAPALVEEVDSHLYPSNVSLSLESPYNEEEVVCWYCWLYFVRTGIRHSQRWAADLENDDLSDIEIEVSEDEYSPYLVHT